MPTQIIAIDNFKVVSPIQVVMLHDSVPTKQKAVDALDKLQLEEEILRDIASGYVLPADATAEARAQRKAAIDRLRESVRRAHGCYIREITVVRYSLILFCFYCYYRYFCHYCYVCCCRHYVKLRLSRIK